MLRSFPSGLSLILSVFILSGCANNQTIAHVVPEVLTPLPVEKQLIDPSNKAFAEAIQAYLKDKKAPGHTRYEMTRIDLDNDGRREGLVNFIAPYNYWCNRYGCSMAVFKAHNNGFSKLSEISPIRGPIVISQQKTQGWHDLIVRVPGKSLFDKAKDVILRFNGRTYPEEPEKELELYASRYRSNVSIFP